MKTTKDVPKRFTHVNIMGLQVFQQTEAISGIYFLRGILPAFQKLLSSLMGVRVEMEFSLLFN